MTPFGSTNLHIHHALFSYVLRHPSTHSHLFNPYLFVFHVYYSEHSEYYILIHYLYNIKHVLFLHKSTQNHLSASKLLYQELRQPQTYCFVNCTGYMSYKVLNKLCNIEKTLKIKTSQQSNSLRSVLVAILIHKFTKFFFCLFSLNNKQIKASCVI